MIKFLIKNVVGNIKSFITKNTNDFYEPAITYDDIKKTEYIQNKVYADTATQPLVSELEKCITGESVNNVYMNKYPAKELNIDDNEVLKTSILFNKQIENNTLKYLNNSEKSDFAEIKSIISGLSEKLEQCNKWLLELNTKISKYENRDLLQAVYQRSDDGGYGIDLPLDLLGDVSDEDFFKNKEIPEVLLANLNKTE